MIAHDKTAPVPSADGADLAFLGEEFLTWLWFHLETEGGDFALSNERHVGIALDDMIAFSPHADEETEQTLRKGLPSRSPEARAALGNGHRVRRMRLNLAWDSLQWRFTLDGSTMHLGGITLPDDDEEAADADERSRERAAHFMLLHELVGEIYSQFLGIRLREDYGDREGTDQARWMQGA